MAGSWELCISVKPNTIKLAVCRFNKRANTIEVKKAFQVNIPEEFLSMEEAARSKAIIGLVRNALKTNKVKQKKYNLSISGREIITRIVKLPKMNFKDLESFMKLSIQQYFPIKSEEYCFDYKIQNINEKDEKTYYNLLLVAIPKNIIDYYSKILLGCGIRPQLISIYSDIASNLFLKFLRSDIAIIDINYDYTEFIMLEGKSIFINSIINYSIPPNDSSMEEETYLKNLDMDNLGEDFQNTVETIKNYINFFLTRHQGKTLEEIYLIGKGSLMPNAASYLEEKLNLKIKRGQDLLDNRLKTSLMPRNMLKDFHPESFCGCLGLVVRGINR